MKHKTSIIGLIIVLFLFDFCSAQNSDAKITIGHNPSLFPVLYSIDNLSIQDTSAIRKINLNRKIIKRIQLTNDTVFGFDHKPKFVGTIKICTKKKYNFGIKNISKLSGDWMKEHPLSLYMLNDQLLLDDFIKYNLLSSLIVEDIKGFEFCQPELAIKKYGTIAFNGVFIIKTK
jgi:hypothetical protein